MQQQSVLNNELLSPAGGDPELGRGEQEQSIQEEAAASEGRREHFGVPVACRSSHCSTREVGPASLRAQEAQNCAKC